MASLKDPQKTETIRPLFEKWSRGKIPLTSTEKGELREEIGARSAEVKSSEVVDQSNLGLSTITQAINEISAFVTSVASLKAKTVSTFSIGTKISVGGYYANGDGGGGDFVVRDKEVGETEDLGLTFELSDGRIAERMYSGNIIAKWFGFLADLSNGSGTNEGERLHRMGLAAPSGSTIDFEDLQIYYSTAVNFTKDLFFIGNGAKLYGDGVWITALGALTEIGPVLDGAQTIGSRSITVTSANGLSVGDILIIHNQVDYSFSQHRTYYQDGEFKQIQSIGGLDVYFTERLETSYDGASTDVVFRLDAIRFKTSGIDYEGTGVHVLRARYVKDFEINGDVIGGTISALILDKCYNFKLLSGFFKCEAPATSQQYGFTLSNCQHGYASPACRFFGTRHGTATGGDAENGCVPNRHILFDACSIATSAPALHAADFHGNIADSYYRDCDIHGGVGISGYNTGCPGSKITCWHGTNPVSIVELVGGLINLDGIHVICLSTSTATRFIGAASTTIFANVSRDYQIRANNVVFESNSSILALVIWGHNAPGTVKWSFEMVGVKILGDISSLDDITYFTITNSASHAIAPIRPYSIRIDNIESVTPLTNAHTLCSLFGGSYTGMRLTLPKFQMSGEMTIPIGSASSGTQMTLNHPVYPVIPLKIASNTGQNLTADATFLAVIFWLSTASQAKCRLVLTNGDTVTATLPITETVHLQVGLDNYLMP